MEGVFEDTLPAITGVHQAPVHAELEDFRLHLEVFTIRRAVGKLKYLAGSESAMGAFVNDITPETAAQPAARRVDGGPMKALVVGGAGYIGSVVTRQLLAEGNEVVVLDDCSTGHADSVPPGAELVQRDITEAADGSRSRRVRCGVAFRRQVAGRRVGRRSRRSTGGPMSAARGRCWTRSTRTMSRPWSSPRRPPPTESPTRCRSPRMPPTRPTNTYGATKLAVDMMITGECAATDLAAVSLRYFNVAGRGVRRRRAARD